jgi:quercetin dioxygenase-like cupin family protein
LFSVLIPIAGLCADHGDAKIDILVKSSASWDGGALPAYPNGQPEVTIAKIIIPPGKALPFHQHPVINAGCLLKGTLTVETDEGRRACPTADVCEYEWG